MLNNKTVAVVVPAYNEEKQIGLVIETIPEFVDRIIVVSDASTDGTGSVVRSKMEQAGIRDLPVTSEAVTPNRFSKAEEWIRRQNEAEKALFPEAETVSHSPSGRLVLITLRKNKGVGASIAKGYKWCKDHHIDCTAVMAGDGQMDPYELEPICYPVVKGETDYVKGNRLRHKGARFLIPGKRFFGNSVLSILTKISSGYWQVSDTQTGYTAISLQALNAIELHRIYPRYGMPNDILVKLNIAYCTIREVDVKPVYNVGEKSKMRIFRVILPISWLLLRSFFKRLWVKYLFRDFHPLFILYHMAILLLLVSVPYGIKLIRLVIQGTDANPLTALAFAFLFITGFQSLLFAMWMDIQDNEKLYK